MKIWLVTESDYRPAAVFSTYDLAVEYVERQFKDDAWGFYESYGIDYYIDEWTVDKEK